MKAVCILLVFIRVQQGFLVSVVHSAAVSLFKRVVGYSSVFLLDDNNECGVEDESKKYESNGWSKCPQSELVGVIQ